MSTSTAPFSWDDTIAALASPPGPGWRGILRLTGPATVSVLRPLFQTADDSWQTSRRASRWSGHVAWPDCRGRIPAELQLWPTARSYTGQPVAELHLIGSPPLLEALLAQLFACGARPARPGEFTLRAFLAGRIDLLQAEAVLGVIDARDDDELRIALEQLAGGISQPLAALRSNLLDLLADLEAGLDFVDEHLEFVGRQEIAARVAAARCTLEQLRHQAAGRGTSGEGPRVVLAGLPNAGKSTLFNALAGQTRALVSPQAGTTRDYLTVRVQWSGQELVLIDTAGFEQPRDALAAEAQALGRGEWQRADLVVWCAPADLSLAEQADDECGYALAADQAHQVLRITTKADLGAGGEGLRVSAVDGTGLDKLRARIVAELNRSRGRTQWVGATVARCMDSLATADAALARAEELAAATDIEQDELLAVELREALEALGDIVGAVYTNELLDRIFSRFCIGK
uniref:tRNA modification GTPase MnmE n=1 Tax=Schlesneria paludicola TaxID=360056 RepID=A0A7C4LJY7_9PLAN